MTRKDYIKIADALREYTAEQHRQGEPLNETQWDNLLFFIGLAFANDNPRYDRTRFESYAEREQWKNRMMHMQVDRA